MRGLLLLVALLEGAFGQIAHGSFIHVGPCNTTNPSQLWKVAGASIQIASAALCVDCNGCAENTMGYLWECNATNTNQIFKIGSDGMIRHVNPDTCLGTYGTGNLVRSLPCNQSDSRQKWTIDANGFIRSKASGLCMDVDNQYYTKYPCSDSSIPNGYACGCVPGGVSANLPFCDSKLPIASRVKDLIGRLSLAEKLGFLGPDVVHTDTNICTTMDAGVPRLGIPPYTNLVETNSAVAAVCVGENQCATEFPSPALLAASFNRSSWHTKGVYLSDEMRAFSNLHLPRGCCGLHSFIGQSGFGPNINIVRDPRFGRNSELPTEDPLLAGTYASYYVQGMQNGTESTYLKMIAGLKHFTAYSVEDFREGRMFNISTFDLFDTYLAQYELGFAADKGNAMMTMCSYAGVNGVSMCANDYLLNQVIRGKFKRPDVVVATDCGAINNMLESSKYAHSAIDAAAKALNGGADLDTGDTYFGPESSGSNLALQGALDTGATSEAAVDRALTRILTARFRVGQFDPVANQPYTKIGKEVINSTAHWDFVLDTALQGLILLRNEHNTLPFTRDAKKRLAVVGPHIYSQRDLFEDYVGDRVCNDGTYACVQTIADVFMRLNGPNTTVAQGVDIDSLNASGIPAALSAVKGADMVVMVLGIGNGQEREGLDRPNMLLPGLQESFAQQVLALGRPTVVVLINGGALSIDDVDAPAIIEAFYPAMRTGEALYQAIFGQANRWGKLPVTIYRADYANEVDMYNFDMSLAPGRTYRYFSGRPLWPFGFGLSYTSFEVKCSLSANIMCQLHNTGTRDGDAVLMIYHSISDDIRSGLTHPAPISSLVDFGRFSLKAAEFLSVTFSYSKEMLGLTNNNGDRILYPGVHQLTVTDGVSASSVLTVTINPPSQILETALGGV